jgi:hypothetical protein
VTALLINAALAGLLIVVVARAAVAYRVPRARLAWLAAFLGSLALLTQGTIIPIEQLDGALGGSNVLKLIQGILTMVALWLGVQVGTAAADARVRTLPWSFPAILAAAFTFSFLLIPDRGTTSFLFVENGARTSDPIWLYGVVHMVGIALIGLLLFHSARAAWPTPRRFFRIGAIAVVVGCATEVADLTLTRFAQPIPLITGLFDPLFYLGVVCLVGGAMAAWAATRRIRRRGEGLRARLETVARDRQIADFAPMPAHGSTEDRLYSLRVGVEDDAIARTHPLDNDERALLNEVDAYLTRPKTGVRS